MNKALTETQASTSVGSYSIDYGSLPTCIEKDVASYSLKKNLSNIAKVASLVSITTATTMLIEMPEAPSLLTTPYVYASKSEAKIAVQTILPYGYDIINQDKVFNYLLKHRELKDFFESSLSKFQEITGTTKLALEYEGMEEEEWESLYVIIRLDEYDEERINDIENTIFQEWLNDVPEDIFKNITISIS